MSICIQKVFSVQVLKDYGHFFVELKHKRLLPTKIFFMNAHFVCQFKKLLLLPFLKQSLKNYNMSFGK